MTAFELILLSTTLIAVIVVSGGRGPAGAVMAVTAVIAPFGSVLALGLIDPWLAVAFGAGFPALALVLRRFVRESRVVRP